MEQKLREIELLHRDISRSCGQLALQMDDVSMAFKILSGNLARDPFDLATILLLCDLYLKNADYSNVVELLGDPLQKGWPSAISGDRRVWTRLSLAYFHLHNLSEALAAISKAIELSSREDPYLFVLRCRIFLKMSKARYSLDSVMPFFEKTLILTQASQIPSLHVEALLSRSRLFMEYADFGRARMDIDDSMSILHDPNALNFFEVEDFLLKATLTYCLAATVQETSEKSSEVVELGLRNFEHTDKTALPLLLMKTIHRCIQHKNLNDILSELILSLNCLPTQFHCMISYAIARVFLEIDNVSHSPDAYQYLHKSLELADDQDPLALVSLGFLHFNQKRFNDSLSTFFHAIKLPDSVNYKSEDYIASLKAYSWYGIAKNYFSAADITKGEKALDMFRKIITASPVSSSVLNLDICKISENCEEYFDLPPEFLKDEIIKQECSNFIFDERMEQSPISSLPHENVSRWNCDSRFDPISNISGSLTSILNNPLFCDKEKATKKKAKSLKKKKNDIFRKMPLSITKPVSKKPKRDQQRTLRKTTPSNEVANLNDQILNPSDISPHYDSDKNSDFSNPYQVPFKSAHTYSSYRTPAMHMQQQITFPASTTSSMIYYSQEGPYMSFNNVTQISNNYPNNNANNGQRVLVDPTFGNSLYIVEDTRLRATQMPSVASSPTPYRMTQSYRDVYHHA